MLLQEEQKMKCETIQSVAKQAAFVHSAGSSCQEMRCVNVTSAEESHIDERVVLKVYRKRQKREKQECQVIRFDFRYLLKKKESSSIYILLLMEI